jgi:flavin reductase (DIM6/NTAB) family NADH-FMN oxidoreductase RutF
MELDPQTLKAESTYKLLIGCVVPRPIAWVSTVGANGVNNLAPFSFFMGVCGGRRPSRSRHPRSKDHKDTVRNAEHTGDFVVNIVDDDRAEQMNLSSGEYPPEVDEFALTGLTAAPGVRVRSPRVLQAPVSLECRVAQVIPVGRGPHSLVLGEIVYFHVRDDVYDAATGRIDVARLKPVGRLAGHQYSYIHDIFEMKRPNENYRG